MSNILDEKIRQVIELLESELSSVKKNLAERNHLLNLIESELQEANRKNKLYEERISILEKENSKLSSDNSRYRNELISTKDLLNDACIIIQNNKRNKPYYDNLFNKYLNKSSSDNSFNIKV